MRAGIEQLPWKIDYYRWYDYPWLRATLEHIGFEDVEIRLLPWSGGHSYVLARRAAGGVAGDCVEPADAQPCLTATSLSQLQTSAPCERRLLTPVGSPACRHWRGISGAAIRRTVTWVLHTPHRALAYVPPGTELRHQPQRDE
ncbi:MAG TPA: hypothetical protein VMG35_25095 [Bryobacteraceae bacterium]|nr:hypothetical protein [Bryobacteraceae bacterium]